MVKHNTYDLSGDFGIGYTDKGEKFYFDISDYEKIKMEQLLKSIDALNIDLDTPMHFTPEQKAWIKKYIIKNAQANYERGAREFAEKIKSDIEKWWYRSELDMGAENVNSLIDGVLSEWQKGTENDV